MNVALLKFFVARGLPFNGAIGVVKALQENAPWLGADEEVSEEIGVELLEGILPSDNSTKISAKEVIEWHNERIRLCREGSTKMANSAYISLVALVKRFGSEDGLGRGDFWVVEDSFSESRVTIVFFGKLPLPDGMENALVEWLHQQVAIHAIAIVDSEGEALAGFNG